MGTKPGTIAHIRDIFYRMGMNDQVLSNNRKPKSEPSNNQRVRTLKQPSVVPMSAFGSRPVSPNRECMVSGAVCRGWVLRV